jgi:nuclear pore complex protein Nup210
MDMRGFGHWLSSNEKIVHINRITGEAQARSEGVAEGSLNTIRPSITV